MAKQPDPSLLRCLAVQQPWAWAICTGVKTVENRPKSTPYNGLVAILASTTRTNVNAMARATRGSKLDPDFFPFGAIIGVATLVEVVKMNASLESNPSAFGPYCWVFENPMLLRRPIPSSGKLNLYRLTTAESDAVRKQLPGLRSQPLSRDGEAWAKAYRDRVALGRAKNRAWKYLELELPADAIRNFDTALQEHPDDDAALLGRAIAYLFGQKDAQRAILDCTAALRIKPDSPNIYMVRHEAYRLSGDEVRAEADRRRAAKLNPEFVANWRYMDWNANATGLKPPCSGVARDLAEDDPDDVEAVDATRTEAEAADTLTIACPTCRQVFGLPPNLFGKTFTCPSCQAEAVIPRPEGVHQPAPSVETAFSVALSCPRCERAIRVAAEKADGWIACPSCSLAFRSTLPLLPPPPPTRSEPKARRLKADDADDDLEDALRRRRRREKKRVRRWLIFGSVATGVLLLLLIAFLASLKARPNPGRDGNHRAIPGRGADR